MQCPQISMDTDTYHLDWPLAWRRGPNQRDHVFSDKAAVQIAVFQQPVTTQS